MLQIGNPGLTLTEQKSQMSAWSLVAAPLLISTDLISGVDNATLAILSAPEVIAVHQDALAVQVCLRKAICFSFLAAISCVGQMNAM
jgi:alpha-galactosidase